MTAFWAKLADLIAKYAVKYFISYVIKWAGALLERLKLKKVQEQKDKDQLKKTQDAVKNGTEDQIVKETEKLLNG